MKSMVGRMEDMQRDVKDLNCQLHTAECSTEKDLCREAIDPEGSVWKKPMQPSLSSDLLADVLQPLISQHTIPDAVQPSLLSPVAFWLMHYNINHHSMLQDRFPL